MISKSKMLRELINSKSIRFILEVHDGISASIVEEAGFPGIWASGLAISATLGVRDSNEASWTQILEIVEFMSDCTSIPILVDGDTGYGNFNNARRFVRKLEQRGIAGVCIEDKSFPKTNSFIAGEKQQLASISEFTGKLKAIKDYQHDPDFVIVARTEAFITGMGLDEALKRATAYREAGADAILVHSKKNNPEEIISFMGMWDNKCPIVIVPTKYYATPTKVFKDLGISTVIWANHSIRSSVAAMQKNAKEIFNEENLRSVEDTISPLSEIFRLQGDDELRRAEALYLPRNKENTKAIILAASRGKDLGELTKYKSKVMLKIGEKTILERLVNTFNGCGIQDLSVVRGYKKHKVILNGLDFIDNDDYFKSKQLYSLWCARERLKGSIVISYGDILFKKYMLLNLMDDKGDISLAVEANPAERKDKNRDYVQADEPYTKEYFQQRAKLLRMNPELSPKERTGEWIGLLRSNDRGTSLILKILKRLKKHKDFMKMELSNLINELIKEDIEINVVYVDGNWLDIDNIDSISIASTF